MCAMAILILWRKESGCLQVSRKPTKRTHAKTPPFLQTSACAFCLSFETAATPMPLNKDLREFVELLNSNGVDFLVVGAFAVVKFEVASIGIG